jgi:hypothetical protein
MYQVQCQFIPGNSQIWVAQLTPEDPIYDYDTENAAWVQAVDLQEADPTGRLYRVVYI